MRYLIFILSMGALLSALSVLTACGKGYIDSDFQSYVEKFKDAAKSNGAYLNSPGLNIRFDDKIGTSGEGEQGRCENDGGLGAQSIYISTTFWNNASDLSREQLIFHELGHCVLGREHVSATTYDSSLNKVPTSLMMPSLPGDMSYGLYHDEYVHELFHPGEFKI